MDLMHSTGIQEKRQVISTSFKLTGAWLCVLKQDTAAHLRLVVGIDRVPFVLLVSLLSSIATICPTSCVVSTGVDTAMSDFE